MVITGMTMNKCSLFLLCAIAIAPQLHAQTAPAAPTAATASTPAATEREASWMTLLPNVASDQKQIWLFPRKLTKPRYIWPTLAVIGATAALVALDPKDAPWFKNNSAFTGYNTALSGSNTQWPTLAVPVALYSAGLIRRDKRMKSTAILAGEAVGDVEILTTVMKDITNRTRPAAIGTGQSYSDTWFNSSGSFLRGHGSFPSGHTVAAFSVATVISRRYGRNHKWITLVSYGLASAVGFSRVTLSAHFISDVFMGGALGYTISRFAVLHE